MAPQRMNPDTRFMNEAGYSMRLSHPGVFNQWITTLLLALAMASPASAQIRMLTIIAPASPGGGWDQTSREMQKVIEEHHITGAAKVVNVPGAGGTIGLAQFVDAYKGNGDVL